MLVLGYLSVLLSFYIMVDTPIKKIVLWQILGQGHLHYISRT